MKDLAGLSEPLMKLIEVLTNGIGAVASPFLIRRNADARAYELKTIISALADSQQLITKIEYNNSGWVLTSGEVTVWSMGDSALSANDRALARLNYQKIPKQMNLEKIISLDADELCNETVSNELVSQDWIFSIEEEENSTRGTFINQIYGRSCSQIANTVATEGNHEQINELLLNNKQLLIEGTRTAEETGRNDPCPCGSGKKYKKCCAPYKDTKT